MLNRWIAAAGSAAFAGVCAGQDSAAGPGRTVTLTAVVATGDVLPQAGTIRQIISLDVNDRCFIAAGAQAWAPGTDNTREVILVGPHRGPLTAAAIGGQTVPGDPRYTLGLRGFRMVQVGGAGELSYGATLTRDGGATAGLVRAPFFAGAHTVLARQGEPVPGLAAGVTWAFLTEHQQSDTPFLATLATVVGPGISGLNDQVLLTAAGPTPTLLQEGTPVASLGGGVLGFNAGSTPTTRSSTAVWTGSITFPGRQAQAAVLGTFPVQIVVKQGDSAPGAPGSQFQEFLPFPSIGSRGFEVAYTAALAGGGVTEANRRGIWTRSGEVLARAGEPAPGTPEGVRYLSFSAPVLYGPDNAVLFTAMLQGVTAGGRTALFAGPRGAVSLIAREGQQAPGTPDGVAFGAFSESAGGAPVFVNDAGVVVFPIRLSGPGVTTDNDVALYAWDQAEGLALVAREGQVVEMRGGTRTIATISLNVPMGALASHTNGHDGRRTILNRHGECFFIATFVEHGHQALMKAQVTRPPCVADFNADRFIDCFDYLDFVDAFERGDPTADVNDDEFVDFFDYAEFVGWFETGC